MARPFRLGRDGRAFRRAREEVLRAATVCAICGGALDFDAPPRSRWAPSADHVVPVSTTVGWSDDERRALAEDPAHLRAVHYGCNSRRGAGRPARAPRVSRNW